MCSKAATSSGSPRKVIRKTWSSPPKTCATVALPTRQRVPVHAGLLPAPRQRAEDRVDAQHPLLGHERTVSESHGVQPDGSTEAVADSQRSALSAGSGTGANGAAGEPRRQRPDQRARPGDGEVAGLDGAQQVAPAHPVVDHRLDVTGDLHVDVVARDRSGTGRPWARPAPARSGSSCRSIPAGGSARPPAARAGPSMSTLRWMSHISSEAS